MTADEEICKGCEHWEKMCSKMHPLKRQFNQHQCTRGAEGRDYCSSCNLKSVCSDSRKKRHGSGCEDYEYLDSHAWFAGGSPPRQFCPICVHKAEKCISSLDIKSYAWNCGCTFEQAKNHIIDDLGYILSEYSMLEGQCMMSCDRFEEKE